MLILTNLIQYGWMFSKINDRHKTTNPGSSHNTKQDKYKKNKATLKHIIFKLEKIKDKRKFWKKLDGLGVAGSQDTLPVEKQR